MHTTGVPRRVHRHRRHAVRARLSLVGDDPELPVALPRGGRWHFFFVWLFILNGLIYLIYGFAARHFQRDLAPPAVISAASAAPSSTI